MPKRRILPFIILGIVSNHPHITGREVTAAFSTEIGDFWKAAHSQIYPELRRMVDDRWLTSATNRNNAKERYYTVTPAGQAVLDKWLGQTVDELPIRQDLFSLKLFFINDPHDPRIEQLIAKQTSLLRSELTHLLQRQQTLFLDEQAVKGHYGHYLILTRAISRTMGQLAWLKQVAQYSDQ